MKKYYVRLMVDSFEDVYVEADNEEQAEKLALERAKNANWVEHAMVCYLSECDEKGDLR